MHEAFVRDHVGGAAADVFAGYFDGDAAGEEGLEAIGDEFVQPVFPDLFLGLFTGQYMLLRVSGCGWLCLLSTYSVVHVGGAESKHAVIVRKLGLIDIGAILGDIRAVVHGICLVVDEAYALHPIPRLDHPVRVRRVAGIPVETGAQVQEATVGDAVLVIVSVIRKGDLPPQSAAARLVVPIGARLRVEDGLGQSQPLRFIGWRIRELHFRGAHGGKSPEGLVVVSQGRCYVGGHVCVVLTDLELQGLHYVVVIR